MTRGASRDLHQSEEGVDVSLSCCGFSGEHPGIFAHPIRDAQAAKRFFPKALAAPHTTTPRAITVYKNVAYPKAL